MTRRALAALVLAALALAPAGPARAQAGGVLVAVSPFGDRTLALGRAGDAATLEAATRLRAVPGVHAIAGAMVERVAGELGLGVPGLLSAADAARLARALGVGAVLTGEVTRLDIVGFGVGVGPAIVQPAFARVGVHGRLAPADGASRDARVERTVSGAALAVARGGLGVAVGDLDRFSLQRLVGPAVDDLIRRLDPAAVPAPAR